MYGVSQVVRPIGWVLSPIFNHPKLSAITILAGGCFYFFSYSKVRVPIPEPKTLTPDEIQKLKEDWNHKDTLRELASTLSPGDLASRINLYFKSMKSYQTTLDPVEKNPTYNAFMELHQKCPTLSDVRNIFPSHQDHISLSEEEKQAVVVQAWATTLQPIFAFIRDVRISWRDILQPIQSSPRLVYTIIFNCMAPYATNFLWEGIESFLPKTVHNIGAVYVNNRGKIALLSLGVILWLYHRMRHETGIITNLTQNFATAHRAHMGIDLLPSYKKALHELLKTLSITEAGQAGSNILWSYNKYIQTTFSGDIADILAEMIATGRNTEETDYTTSPRLRHIETANAQNLQILKVNLNAFLNNYRNTEAVHQGWFEVSSHFTKDTLVVFTGLDRIEYFFPSESKEKSHLPGYPYRETYEVPPSKHLFNLLIEDLKQGKFRCLIEAEEAQARRLEADGTLSTLFQTCSAPNIPPVELEKLCTQLFSECDTSTAPFSKEVISDLFVHLKPTLETTPIRPKDLISTLQTALRLRTQSWVTKFTHNTPAKPKTGSQIIKQKEASYELYKKIEESEKNLAEAAKNQENILIRLWENRRLGHPVTDDLLRELVIQTKIIIPAYRKIAYKLKKPYLADVELVDLVQQRFRRLFGNCTSVEEARLKKLPRKLKKAIKGQDAAIDQICSAVLQWRTTFSVTEKPLVIFVAGPPGVGKSETASLLAFKLITVFNIYKSAVRNHELNVIRVNLNRPQQGGHLGWDKVKNDILIQVFNVPTSVIIFEEWDKMKQEDKSSLLELLDGSKNYLQVQDAFGRETRGPYVDLNCSTIIFTSNIQVPKNDPNNIQSIENGIKDLFKSKQDRIRKDASTEQQDAMKSDAFISRLDAIIPFEEINEKSAVEILEVELNKYVYRGCIEEGKKETVQKELTKKVKTITDGRDLKLLIRKAVCLSAFSRRDSMTFFHSGSKDFDI